VTIVTPAAVDVLPFCVGAVWDNEASAQLSLRQPGGI